ncbi:uncharacterized protein LOC126733284 [Quercus robur]|uniref:uncharacterized protein LOC126733284 n=1 Tax=Quercus robur TaxID=38942 RepID=UPI002163EE5D|nr:uncharacterized protein LOC126733284 [Quercus robur]
MATMKGNKGKDVAGEGDRPEVGDVRPGAVPQTRPSAGDKRKSLPKNLDLGSLPSRRDKRVKHSSSKVAKPILPQPNLSVQTIDVDVSPPVEMTSSRTPPRTTAPTSSQLPSRVSSNIVENEDLAWQRFQEAVKDEDIHACYDMSLKDFEHSGVHDLFKAMSKFIAASRQATELDKTRILLETTIKNVREESKKWAGVAAEAKEKEVEQLNLIAELKAAVVEKDSRLDHLQAKNDELSTSLSKAKDDAIAEFKASKDFTDLLDRNYAAGFEDFRMDAVENFPEVDFNSIKLNLNAATSSLLQTSSEDVNIEDDASTQPPTAPA